MYIIIRKGWKGCEIWHHICSLFTVHEHVSGPMCWNHGSILWILFLSLAKSALMWQFFSHKSIDNNEGVWILLKINQTYFMIILLRIFWYLVAFLWIPLEFRINRINEVNRLNRIAKIDRNERIHGTKRIIEPISFWDI